MEGQLKNGTILTSESGNKYEVVSLLGAGGQGEVYDVKLGSNHYALKLKCYNKVVTEVANKI